MADKLSDDVSRPGMLVVNYGDPGYLQIHNRSDLVTPTEDVFLRLISYLPFAEAIIVPGRNIVGSPHVFESVQFGQSLLKAGLLIPERRAGADSFEDVARIRKLDNEAMIRAEFLDRHTPNVRVFKWEELSSTYRNTLLDDLSPTGAFRRVVRGGTRGHLRAGLDAAHDLYAASGEVTPEGFVSAVEEACKPARAAAHRWAMAHYYLTPTRFDDVNIRQIPKEAADLLIRGRVLADVLRPTSDLAPGERLVQELSVGIQVNEVTEKHEAYCEAVLKVRQDVPEARELFKRIVSQTEAREVGDEVNAAMKKELEKQLRTRWLDSKKFSMGVDMVGGAIAGAAGLWLDLHMFTGASIGGGVAGGQATTKIRENLVERYDRKKRPWKLAIDRVKGQLTKK